MTSKKYLSEKKVPLTISISNALKEWIERYIRVKQREEPTKEIYKNRSIFLNYVLENVMKLMEKGRSIEEFTNVPDKDIIDFYEPITFRGVIPVIENALRTSRYTKINIEKTPHLFLGFYNLIMKDIDPYDYKALETFVERAKIYLVANNTFKELNLEITNKSKEHEFKGYLEFIGYYKNLHYENIKVIAGIMGIIGLKAKSMIFSEKELYSRIDFISTELYYNKEIVFERRIELIKENFEVIINYDMFIFEDEMYLWMKLVKDNNFIITFQDENQFEQWFEQVSNDFIQYGHRDSFHLKILRIFEVLHWISIENRNRLRFSIRLDKEKNSDQITYLKNILNKYGELNKDANDFVLKK
ncbi:MAG: hypothetical protein GF317_18935, partial [Candidatus Lokiarchaeota archaeon]|nr:hypothetical protein [Candidatus Lokiarchaeota archaeon]MBD3201594.1 hypothetical protein [Candidatus Lokiarchaeota archaeon]